MRKSLRIIISVLLLCAVCTSPAVSPAFAAQNTDKAVTILFTGDLHDHLLPARDIRGGKVIYSGGYARLESAVKAEKMKEPEALLLDAGDFSMGTAFQTIYESDSPQFRMMGELGYDAVTLGNHEFDYRAEGLANSLKAAVKSGSPLPQVVISNEEYPADKNGNISPDLTELKKAEQTYGVKEYTVLERNGIKIGIFGLMGKDAASNAPMSGVVFADPVENAKRIVDTLKNREKADLIVCLSHSGIWGNKSESEDEILAKEVPDINVIISGHTHTRLPEPITAGNTVIGSVEDSCRYLGVMKISQNGSGGWKLDNYKLQPIDESLSDDPGISGMISDYEKLVQQKYFDRFGMGMYDVLAQSPFDFNTVNYMTDHHQEDPLGNLISDSYIYAVKKAEGDGYVPVDAAIVPVGTIRNTFFKGNVTASDVYSASSLGIGPDKVPGYPLISIWLTGKELKAVCEVDASVSSLMGDAQLYISGVDFTFNPNRLIFNKVTEVKLRKPDGSVTDLDDNRLYRVVAGLFSAQMLSVVGDKSFGLLSIVPKTAEGKPIKNFEESIANETSGGKAFEVKEWYAIAEYLQSFDKVDGIPQISGYYGKAQGRKVIDDNHSIVAFLKAPNRIALAVYGIVTFIVLLAAFIIYRLATRRKRRQKKLDRAKKRLTGMSQ
ncbi:MAG TPA: bifunctional UDP-sugar hydrolase/5'-nucleotidase [Clostridia bacterium]|nr:bifunctional UDP-sugar hydrolase/5'-nucleotidase [Clostridia bacterium]